MTYSTTTQKRPFLRNKTSILAILIVLVFILHSLFYVITLGTDAVDDAYISFRYAQNAVRGNGLFFNAGERVEGFTNFLWTAAMIPIEGAGMDVGRTSMLLGALFALGVMWLVVQFAKIAELPRAVGWLTTLFLAVDGSFVLWSVSGLETVMFAFIIFAGMLLYIREQEWNIKQLGGHRQDQYAAFPFSGIFFALAAMTRPEGVMVFALTVAHQAVWRLVTERRLFTSRDILRGFAFSAIFAPYWLGRWWYYKSFLPNSFYAKVSASGPVAQIERGWAHLSQFVGVHLGWLVPIFALSTTVSELWTRYHNKSQFNSKTAFWSTYFSIVISAYSAYIIYVGGDWSVGRFFVPLLAPFYFLLSTALVNMWITVVETRLAKWGQVVKITGISVIILLAGLLLFASSWNGEYGIFIKGFDAGRATDARETMGRWLKINVPRGTLIAVDAAGQVPYFSELPSIDMFGINDLHIGRLSVATLGQGTPGHEKFDLVYIIQRQPDYVVIFGTLLDTVKEYERAPVQWTTDPALQKFLTLYQRKK